MGDGVRLVGRDAAGPAAFEELEAETTLPVPASATTPTTWPWPSSARANAASSVCISSLRPTKRVRPRDCDTASRVRSVPVPSSSCTRSGAVTPGTANSPRSRRRK